MSGCKGKILVVDDEPNLCWVLERLLRDRGHEVRVATTATGGLAVLGAFECQVAVVDFRLPDGDGLRLLRKMRALSPRLLGILMTSYGNAELRERALAEQVFAYLDKPFKNDFFLATVEQALCAFAAGADSPIAGVNARNRFPE